MKFLKYLLVVFIFILVFGLIFFAYNKKLNSEGLSTINFEGRERFYRLYVPSSYNKENPAALVFVLHGGGGRSRDMVKLTKGKFNELAERDGFIVVYPEGVQKHWNDGRGVQLYYAHRENINDVGFINLLIDKLSEEYSIDKKRIYSTGISNGGLMSERLACEMSEKFAAIAPVAVSMLEDYSVKCKPQNSMPILIITGNNDPLVPWDGGERISIEGKIGRILSVPEAVGFWVKHNKCQDDSFIAENIDSDLDDETSIQKEVYDQCENNSKVVFYKVENGGHTWPNGSQYLPEFLVGKTSRDIDASEVIWNFFKEMQI